MSRVSAPCPLCGDRGTQVRHAIAAADVAELYRRSYGVEVGAAIGTAPLRVVHCAACDLAFFDPPAAGGPEFYEQLQRFEWYYPKSKPEFAFAARHVPADAAVLEIGCGEGWFAERLDTRRYVGLEYTARAAEAARARGRTVLLESLETYSAAHPAEADVVCAFQVLEHVPEPARFLTLALAALRPGGALIVSVPSADGYVGASVNNTLNLPPHHVTWWSDRALESLGRVFGLEIAALEHDRLVDEHVDAYLHALVLRSFDRPGREMPPVDLSLRSRLLNRLATLLAPRLRGALRGPQLRPWGHSVTAVYRKSQDAAAPARRATETAATA